MEEPRLGHDPALMMNHQSSGAPSKLGDIPTPTAENGTGEAHGCVALEPHHRLLQAQHQQPPPLMKEAKATPCTTAPTSPSSSTGLPALAPSPGRGPTTLPGISSPTSPVEGTPAAKETTPGQGTTSTKKAKLSLVSASGKRATSTREFTSTRRRSRRLVLNQEAAAQRQRQEQEQEQEHRDEDGPPPAQEMDTAKGTAQSENDARKQKLEEMKRQVQMQQQLHPPAVNLQKITDPAERMSSKHIPSQARVGLLVWVKQSRSSFWPSMLTYDPERGDFVRRNASGAIRSIHVQFFGEVITRAWSSYRSAMRLWDHTRQDGGWEFIKERVKPSWRKAFDIAMEQAQRAANMSLRERILEWTCYGELSLRDEPMLQPTQPASSPSQSSNTSLSTEKDKASKRSKAKAKAKIDENAPRKPKRYLSAFFFFSKEWRKQHADACKSITEAARLIGQAWQALPGEERAPYREMEQRDRERYAREMKKYEAELRAHIAIHGTAATGASKRMLAAASNRPKRGRSAYIFFFMEKEESVAKSCSSQKEKVARLGQLWKELPPDQRSVYQRMQEEDQKRYQAELLAYETDAVVALGHSKVEEMDSAASREKALEQIRNLPNLSVSGHVMFALEATQQLNASMSVADSAKQILEQWSALSPEEQKQWQDKAAATKRKAAKRAAAVAAATASGTDNGSPSGEGTGQPNAGDSTGNAAALSKHDNHCGICGEAGNLLCCEGGCLGSFHLFCIGLAREPEGVFVCDACASGNHLCFACEQPAGPAGLEQCSLRNCGKKYHRACIIDNPRSTVSSSTFKCPLHECANCGYPQASTYPLIRCIRCPTAYHTCCVPAGCLHENAMYLLCPKHQSVEKHAQSNICLACGDGGMLSCCDTCPAAYHRECLKDVLSITGTPTEDHAWHCHECLGGSKAIDQDIIWYKMGSHRFWPARILEHDQIPDALHPKRLKGVCFPVMFFGTNEVAWGRHDAAIRWTRGDEKRRFTASKAKPAFQEAVQEAAAAFDAFEADRATILEAIRGRMSLKPPAFQRIRTNVYTTPRKRRRAPECCCSPDTGTCDETCLNRIVCCECDPKTCPVKDKCQNRRFQKRSYPKLLPFLTSSKGWGLKAGEDIADGRFVTEYVGEIIDAAECRRRLAASEKANDDSFYILSLGASEFVDARNKANLARFINHSCDPNCELQKWNVLGDTRVGIFAKTNIPKGTELTFDYQLDSLGSAGRTTCHCGASTCRGVIEKSGRGPAIGDDGYEEVCHRCRTGGTLLLCDYEGCPRAFHPACASETVPDDDDNDDDDPWFCPAHALDDN